MQNFLLSFTFATGFLFIYSFIYLASFEGKIYASYTWSH